MASYFIDFGKVTEIYSAPFMSSLRKMSTPFRFVNTLAAKWILLYILSQKRIFLKA
jgi:hypothetical protein